MANPEHLEILNQGVEAWNKWREENPDIVPDLRGADLSASNLEHINLNGTLLNKTNLSEARLNNSQGEGAIFTQTILSNAQINTSLFAKAQFTQAQMDKVQFKSAELDEASFLDANLQNSNLSMASMKGAFFSGTDLRGASLIFATFDDATLHNLRYSRFGRYLGIKIDNNLGTHKFRRFAMDQSYIEEFRVGPKHWRFWLFYMPWLTLCDCGRNFFLWFGWCVAAAFGFALKYEAIGKEAFHLANGLEWNFDTLVYYSTVTITTLGFGDVTPITAQAKHWVMAEVIIGYIMLGGLISIFSTKLTRRSG